MKIECCHHCTDKRHYNCHSTCKEYIEQRAALDEQNARLAEERKKHSYQMHVLKKSSGLPMHYRKYY